MKGLALTKADLRSYQRPRAAAVCFILKVISGSCMCASTLTLVPSCVSGRQTGCSPLGARRLFAGDTACCSHRSLSVTFWTFPCLARGVDTGDRGSVDSWTGFGKELMLHLHMSAQDPHLPSQLLPCEGKVFISPQPNTRIRLKAALSTCVCCRPVRPVIAQNSPRQVSVDATDAHDVITVTVVKLRN